MDVCEAVIERIYLIMAQNLEGVEEALPGTVIALGSLDDIVFKTATISSFSNCPSFTPINIGSASILKTHIRPKNIEDMPKLIQGLKKLNKADPAIEVITQQNGEIILGTCGEVHLQRCQTDLEQTFAKCQVTVLEPFIQFKETIIYNNLLEESLQKYKNKKAKVLQDDDSQLKKKKKEKDVQGDVDKELRAKIRQENLEHQDSEVANTFDIEETDLRYHQLKPDEEEKEKKWRYTQQFETTKKGDHKNRGKLNLYKLGMQDVQNKSNLVIETTQNQKMMLKVRAIGIPYELTQWLDSKCKLMRKIFYDNKQNAEDLKRFLDEFEAIRKEIKCDKKLWDLIDNNLVCFGPKKSGPNLLLSKTIRKEDSLMFNLKMKLQNPDYQFEPIIQEPNFQELETQVEPEEQEKQQEERVGSTKDSKSQNSKSQSKNQSLKSNISQQLKNYLQQQELTEAKLLFCLGLGFDMALSAGPLCEEPIIGAAFILESTCFVEEVKQDQKEKQTESQESPLEESKLQPLQESPEKQDKAFYGPLTGQIMAAMRYACLNSFIGAHPRIVEPVYRCLIQTNYDQYGNAFAVLMKRRAKVISEILNSSTNLSIVNFQLPLSTSFGIYSDLQIQTSGQVSAQLDFDGWVILDIDPYFQPSTDENIQFQEVEENGAHIAQINVARQLIDSALKRKGLFVQEKVKAEKQRNLSKKK